MISHKQHTTNIREQIMQCLWTDADDSTVDKLCVVFLTLLDELETSELEWHPSHQYPEAEAIGHNDLARELNSKISHIKLSLKGEQ